MSVTGKWNLTIKAPTGAQNTELEIREENGVLTGVQSGQGVSTDIPEIKVDGNDIAWSSVVTRPMKMKLEFSGVVEGDAMNGKVKAGMMGKYPFTATRA